MKVYLIYLTVPVYIFNIRLKYLIDSVDKVDYKIKDDNVIILYAWTPKKKYVKRFLEERCKDVFTVKTQQIDYDDEYEEFKERHNDAKLYEEQIALFPSYDRYERDAGIEVPDKNNFASMLITKFEVKNFDTFRSENMAEFGPQINADINYDLFNNEIINALTILGYVTLYDSSFTQYFPESDIAISKYERAMAVENLINTGKDQITGLMKTEYIVFIYLYIYTFTGT